jgi:hypothetical protein
MKKFNFGLLVEPLSSKHEVLSSNPITTYIKFLLKIISQLNSAVEFINKQVKSNQSLWSYGMFTNIHHILRCSIHLNWYKYIKINVWNYLRKIVPCEKLQCNWQQVTSVYIRLRVLFWGYNSLSWEYFSTLFWFDG